MANWIVDTTADNGSVDTDNHVGSLRGCISAAASGDTIVFDDSLEVDGVITILLSSQLDTANKNLIIDGEGHSGSGAALSTRVVLDAQADDTTDNQRRVLYLSGSSLCTFNSITVKNGYLKGVSGSSGYGGGVYVVSSASATFNNCVFDSCSGQSGGCFYNNTTGTITLNNCVFKNCSSNTVGGSINCANSSVVIVNNCAFLNNTTGTNGAGVNRTSNSSVIVNNCSFGTTTSSSNIYVASGGSFTLQGTNTVDKFSSATNSAVIFANNAALVVTNSATVNNATFSAASGDSASATFPAGTSLTSATWTNVATTLVVNSTLDDGTGTLRNALTNAVSGTTIVFDNSIEDANGVITIYLGSQLNDSKDVTINGGETWTESGELKTRVVLDAQADDTTDNQRRVLQLSATNQTISGVTFINGYVDGTNYGGGLYIIGGSTPRARIINNCVLKNCSSVLGGGVYITGLGTATFNNCQFLNCESRSNLGGGFVANITNVNNYTVNINNCDFKNCSATTTGATTYANGGAVASTGPCQINLYACNFIGNTAANNGAGFYFSGNGNVVINSCNFGTTTSATNIYNDSTTGTLDFQGTTNVDKFTIRAGSAVTISGVLTVDNLIVNANATLTFSGVDSVLAVTNNAQIGSATFTAAADSTGYAAFPTGTNISAATFGDGVTSCVYGADVQTFTASSKGASWTAVNLQTPILIEIKNGDAWETVTKDATGGSYETTFAEGATVRSFDGARFLLATTSTDAVVSVFGSDWSDVARYALGIKTNPDTPL